jgi:hypothetical protein
MAIVEHESEEIEFRANEEERVIGWRAELLNRAGFDDGTALELALMPHVDLHVACDLVRRGCPPATAARILA